MATKYTEQVTVSPPKFEALRLRLVGTAPLMQARFSGKAMQAMMSKQAAGSTAAKGKARAARDFDQDFVDAMHISTEGWVGVPAAALRNAAISACRMVGFQMTRARMSVFILHDGLDKVDGIPLVKLVAGEPERSEMMVRNATGVADIRVRPMWREWAIEVTVKFDADQFTAADVVNLLVRAGEQCGIGEGRPFSKSSAGLGLGTFRVEAG